MGRVLGAALGWRGQYPITRKRSGWQLKAHLQDSGNTFLCQCR